MNASILCEFVHVRHTVNTLFTIATHVLFAVTDCAFFAKIRGRTIKFAKLIGSGNEYVVGQ